MENSLKALSSKMFELAYFLHPKRELALRLTQQSWAMLEAQLKPQRKRRYYHLNGRVLGGGAVRARTKVSAEEAQRLQSLIYCNSEKLEREQEERLLVDGCLSLGSSNPTHPKLNRDITMRRQQAYDEASRLDCSLGLTDEDWLIRFIEYLISRTVTRSSFYVTLSIGRIVFNYSTEETTKIYDAILQDPDRIKDAPYFRKRKNEFLMKGLKERFGDALRPQVVTRGEERFKCRSDSDKFQPIVKQSLEVFTPWNTGCVLPERLDPIDHIIDELRFNEDDPDTEHPIEFRRMHTIIHPECFSRLTDALKLASPKDRLEVPMFFTSKFANSSQPGDGSGNQGPGSGNSPQRNDRGHPPQLTEEDFAQVQSFIKNRRKRFKRAAPESVTVLVDGTERALVQLDEPASSPLHIEEHARLIEIGYGDEDGWLLLGSLLLDGRECSFALPTKYHLRLAGKRELLLKFSPLRDENQEFVGANIEVTLRRVRPFLSDRSQDSVQDRFRHLFQRPAFVFAALVLLLAVAIGLIVWRKQKTPNHYIAQVQSHPSPLPSTLGGDAIVADASGSTNQQSARSSKASRETNQSKGPTPESSLSEGTRILSSEIPQELSTIRKIYVEVQRDANEAILREAFIKIISETGKVRVADEASADAFFVWTVKSVRGGRQIDLRLLNRIGRVLWTATLKVREGQDDIVAAQVIREMLTQIGQ